MSSFRLFWGFLWRTSLWGLVLGGTLGAAGVVVVIGVLLLPILVIVIVAVVNGGPAAIVVSGDMSV